MQNCNVDSGGIHLCCVSFVSLSELYSGTEHATVKSVVISVSFEGKQVASYIETHDLAILCPTMCL